MLLDDESPLFTFSVSELLDDDEVSPLLVPDDDPDDVGSLLELLLELDPPGLGLVEQVS